MALQNILRTILAVIILSTFNLQTKAQVAELNDNYRRKDYFQLEKIFVQEQARLTDSVRLFYRAVLDNAFNRPSESNKMIVALEDRYGSLLSDSLQKLLLNLKADNAIKQYQYGVAAECYQTIVDKHKTDSAERADLQNSIALWGAVANVPPQQVIQRQNCNVQWKKDKIGLVQVPVSVANDSCDLVFDTGANMSVITQSSAKKLHMKVFPVSISLGAGTTGQTVQSALAVADSLYMGNILLRHVVFLLLPDDMLYFKQMDYRQQGIIGQPLMAQLRQVTIYGDGRLQVPLRASHADYHNIAFDGAMPVVQYEVKGERLPFRFDSGASTSVLYAPFFSRYQNFIKSNGKPYQLKTGGVGGTINKAEAYKLSNLEFRISGKKFTIPEISIRITSVGDEPDFYYGNMGIDIFGHFNHLTMNFQDMHLTVN